MKILLVSAHPDDGEISCGGTIARFKREGHEIRSIYFCPCTEEGSKNEGHLKDHRKAVEILGIDYLYEETFPHDTLEYYKQDVRNILYKLREEYKPDLVLCPSLSDMHQDHKAVAECCLTIFRDTSTILGFEVIRSVGPTFNANYFIMLKTEDVLKKVDAIEVYKSQLKARPYFFNREVFVAQMKMRGTQAKAQWAEAYELIWGRI